MSGSENPRYDDDLKAIHAEYEQKRAKVNADHEVAMAKIDADYKKAVRRIWTTVAIVVCACLVALVWAYRHEKKVEAECAARACAAGGAPKVVAGFCLCVTEAK